MKKLALVLVAAMAFGQSASVFANEKTWKQTFNSIFCGERAKNINTFVKKASVAIGLTTAGTGMAAQTNRNEKQGFLSRTNKNQRQALNIATLTCGVLYGATEVIERAQNYFNPSNTQKTMPVVPTETEATTTELPE